jgi:hypothetical protein
MCNILTTDEHRLGVGAKAQKVQPGELSAMDKLKRQLLGKGATMSKADPAKKKAPKPAASAEDGPIDDDDSDEGRVGAISLKLAPKAKSRNAVPKSKLGDENSSVESKIQPTKASKRNTSFLDEVLSTKKKRKKHN